MDCSQGLTVSLGGSWMPLPPFHSQSSSPELLRDLKKRKPTESSIQMGIPKIVQCHFE